MYGRGKLASHLRPDHTSSLGFCPEAWIQCATFSTSDQTRSVFSPTSLRACSSVAPRSSKSSTSRGYFDTFYLDISLKRIRRMKQAVTKHDSPQDLSGHPECHQNRNQYRHGPILQPLQRGKCGRLHHE